MDYLSLYIEGREYEALKNFEFKQYNWKFLNVERPNLKLDLLLEKNGYIQVFIHHVILFIFIKISLDFQIWQI